MKRLHRAAFLAVCAIAVSGCRPHNVTPRAASTAATLAQARQGHVTRLTRHERANEPLEQPPTSELRLARYPSAVGNLAAYLTPDPGDGKKHAAIIWIFGGFDNGIGSTAWEDAPPGNDQSARAFRQAGIVTMYPALRGGNDNPGFKEGFYGEIDDILAAARFLAQQPYVDPKRIYLGGHSTGGTLALLVSEMTGGFRAVFAFGPVHDVRGYGQDDLPFDLSDTKEAELRAPILWVNSISRPTFVFEGADPSSNIEAVREMAAATHNSNVRYFEAPGKDHFSILADMTRAIAQQILADTSPDVRMAFPATEISSNR